MTNTTAASHNLSETIKRLKYLSPSDSSYSDCIDRALETLDLRLDPEDRELLVSGEVYPSMRLLANSSSVKRENLMAYNCMFIGIDSLFGIPRLMNALMCGVGVGFSVESRYLSSVETPMVLRDPKRPRIWVDDSREGWVLALNEFIKELLKGNLPSLNTSGVRPAGTPMVTSGGYSSGPEPLRELADMLTQKITSGSLRSIDIYDLCCLAADVVKQGGFRRAACICLFDHTDHLMWEAKVGDLSNTPWRYNTNNSAVFDTMSQLTESHYLSKLYKSSLKCGDPGFVIRENILRKLIETKRPILVSEQLYHQLDPIGGIDNKETLKYTKVYSKVSTKEVVLTTEVFKSTPLVTTIRNNLIRSLRYGLNPCGEIILRSYQLCNLSEAVARPTDTLETLMNKVRLATTLGLHQSQLVDFDSSLMGPTLAYNSLVERLLGVSLSGLKDTPELLRDSSGIHGALLWLREFAHQVADSSSLTPKPQAITTVKPSGTVSKLAGCSAGIHSAYSKYYLQNIAIPKSNPLAQWLLDCGVKPRVNPELSGADVVVGFPMSAPEGAITSNTESLESQLSAVGIVVDAWCDHNCSCTIYIDNRPDAQAVLRSALRSKLGRRIVSLSFFHKADIDYSHHLQYLPIEPITESQYYDMLEATPTIPWEYAPAVGSKPRATTIVCTPSGCSL